MVRFCERDNARLGKLTHFSPKHFWVIFAKAKKFFFRQDFQDFMDFFVHHFPDESDEIQSASGGTWKCAAESFSVASYLRSFSNVHYHFGVSNLYFNLMIREIQNGKYAFRDAGTRGRS